MFKGFCLPFLFSNLNPHVSVVRSHCFGFRCGPHGEELYLDPAVAVILLLLAALFAAGTMISTRRGWKSRVLFEDVELS